MRLVINIEGRNANAGLNRYNGRGIFKSLGRKHTGLRKVEKDEADADDVDKKPEGKGIDAVDSSNIKESGSIGVSSSMEIVSHFTEEKQDNDDKESNIDDIEEDEDLNGNEEDTTNDVNLKRKFNEETQEDGVKHKYSPSLVDFLINNNPDDSAIPVPAAKLQRLDSSVSDCQENTVAPKSSDIDKCDIQPNEVLKDRKEDHSLIKIPPTKRRKYPQKACVHCRQKYGIRNDTRYICTLCGVALCKDPCFAVYHYNV